MNDNIEPDDLIKWAELSRYLVGSEETVRRHSIPKKHRAAVDRLRHLIRQWQEEIRYWQ